MSKPVISVEEIGKRYRIGELQVRRHVTFAEVLTSRLKRMVRPAPHTAAVPASEFWALKDVSFAVEQGETVAIIGRNGAGKSTLLKILSRITEPTRGRIRLRGRVASLLEVGTGFHLELTGRENIYLNGIILGMTRKEVDRKLDEIVAFAGVEQFVDTPVKRFSSGMQVRLAFAVAAHLEPEVLIIDEVLAVGDAAFQKKCLGKMKDVASQGRTVLFVSHDLAAVETLCRRAILLNAGQLVTDGPTSQTIAHYQASLIDAAASDLSTRRDRKGVGDVRFTRVRILDQQGAEHPVFFSGKPLTVRLHYKSNSAAGLKNCRVSLTFNNWGRTFFLASTELQSRASLNLPAEGYVDCVVPDLPLSLGSYSLDPFIEVNGIIQDWIEAAATLQVEDGNFYGAGKDYPMGWDGKTVLVRHYWETPGSTL